MAARTPLYTALDIGTTKVVALIAKPLPCGAFEVVGHGSHPCQGLKQGVVVDVEATTEAIRYAMGEAEVTCGHKVESVTAGIAGSHVHGMNANGIVAVRYNEVRQQDIDRVLNAAKMISVPQDQKILHVLPREFIVDNQGGIVSALGMSGVRLEAKVHVVTVGVSVAQNLINCAAQCGIRIRHLVLEQLASSYAVLTEDERQLGVCVMDIGGGTADVAVYSQGAISHVGMIPIAGDHVTCDVAITLRTPISCAEKIKIESGCVDGRMVSSSESVVLDSACGQVQHTASRQYLVQIIQARYEELFQMAHTEVVRAGFEHATAAGWVLTGGAARIPGLAQCAESILKAPCRVAKPSGILGCDDLLNDPAYATAVGLLLSQRQEQADELTTGRGIKSVLKRARHWVVENF